MKTPQLIAAIAAGAVVWSLPLWSAGGPTACSGEFVYDSDADFAKGLAINLTVADGTLTLPPAGTATPLPFVYVACSAAGTIVRIDVNTGEILGEYFTSPDSTASTFLGRDPSRTTVDRFGNCWVGNRAEFGFAPDPLDPLNPDGWEDRGSVARVGLIVGGTRGNKNPDDSFTPDPTGSYLKGPFTYNTCSDRDGDGLIKTSKGFADVLPWSNPADVDSFGGVSSAEDECLINYTRVTGTGTRTLAVDANNDVWVGGLGDRDHEKLDGVTGLPVPGTRWNVGAGGYGGVIDRDGTLWSARELVRFVPDPTPPPAGTSTIFFNDRGDYGLALDLTTGHIWHSSLFSSGVGGSELRLYELDSLGAVVNSYPQPFGAQGVVADGNGHIWMAEIFGGRVWHLAPDPLAPGTHYEVGILSGFAGVTGLSVDANGKIWAAEIGDRVARIDPDLGVPDIHGNALGAIDLTVPLPGRGPYNYSDMTGFVVVGATSGAGTWSAVQDGGVDGMSWSRICWDGSTPAGTSVKLEARAGDSQLSLSDLPFVVVDSCEDLCTSGVLAGRFIEVRVTLQRDSGIAETPVVEKVTLVSCPIPDTEAPTVGWSAVRIPSGYEILITGIADSCDPTSGAYLNDTASGFVAGPFKVGDRLHVRAVATLTPSSTPTVGRYLARLVFKGKPNIVAKDSSGNESTPMPAW